MPLLCLRDPSANCAASCAGVKPAQNRIQKVSRSRSFVAKKSQRKDPFSSYSLFTMSNILSSGHTDRISRIFQTSLCFLNASGIQRMSPLTNPTGMDKIHPLPRDNIDHSITLIDQLFSLPLLRRASPKELVEVNGIEPMTSCLQSRRSPN